MYVTETNNPESNIHELIPAAYASRCHGMFQVCESGISHEPTRHSNVGYAISPFLLTRASCIICCIKEYTDTHTCIQFLRICIKLHFRKKNPKSFLNFLFINFSGQQLSHGLQDFTEYNLGKSVLGTTGL